MQQCRCFDFSHLTGESEGSKPNNLFYCFSHALPNVYGQWPLVPQRHGSHLAGQVDGRRGFHLAGQVDGRHGSHLAGQVDGRHGSHLAGQVDVRHGSHLAGQVDGRHGSHLAGQVAVGHLPAVGYPFLPLRVL